MGEIYVECPPTGGGGTTTSECGNTKTISWVSAGSPETYFYVQNVNKQLISFDFKNITNNGSSVSVEVIYKRNGVSTVAQTYNFGVISANTLKYHFLDFGTTNQFDGLIILNFIVTGGSSGSIDIKLDCNVLVGTRQFCYQSIPSAQRDLCTSCTTTVRLYFQRTTLNDNQTFSYGTWYSDPELQTIAPNGYYRISDQSSPRTIYTFTGTTPEITYYCDPRDISCGSSYTQTHNLSAYTFNNPYLPGTPDIKINGLKYSITDYFIKLPNTSNGVIAITVSNTQTYQSEVVFTVTDSNASSYLPGSLSYSETPPANTESFYLVTYLTLFKVNNNGTKTIYVVVNGDQNKLTKTLRVRVAVGLPKTYGNTSATPVTSTVSSVCPTTVHGVTTGLHVYSPYDAANSPKVTTKLYSLTNPSSWGVNNRVWTDGLLLNPALPYFYSYGSNVFKVGQPFKREFGIKLIYELKTNVIRQLSKLLNISKKNPITITPKTLGPKDWQTLTQVPACIEPVMQDIGIIKKVLPSATLPVPNSYLYLVGKDASVKTLSNDSVFTQYEFNAEVFKPITGLIHALYKITASYMKASKDINIQRNINTDLAAYSALGLGVLGGAIAIFPATFGLAATVSSSIACIGPGLVATASGLSSTGVGVVVAIILLVLVLLFTNVKKKIEEDCKLFDKVYSSGPYLENTNTIYTNSGLTTNGITGYYCDGGYYYTTTNGTISNKELSYTTMDGAQTYSITPDNPTFITAFSSFILLPYVSGIPVRYTTPNNKKRNFAISLSNAPSTSVVGELNTPVAVNYQIPEGFFEEDTQEEADALALDYMAGLTAQTKDIYISAEQKVGASGSTMIFTHEIKVEQTPAISSFFFDNSDGLGITVGKKLYYDTNGIFTVLNGYYSLSGDGGNYRVFYKLLNGLVDDYYVMATQAATIVTSPNSGTLPVITTGQTYTSSWYFYGTNLIDVSYDDGNNLHGFTDDWNTSVFYLSEYVKRGMINSPTTKSSFYIYNSNTIGYSYSNASNGWYNEIPNIFNENPFLIQAPITIYLNSDQYCSDDVNNGIYVTCVDVSGNTIPSFYGVEGSISIYTASTFDSSHNFIIEPGQYQVLVPLSQDYIGQITSTDISITSTNPIVEITFVEGIFTGCVSPTPTPTPVFEVTPTPTVTTTPTSTQPPGECYQIYNGDLLSAYDVTYIDNLGITTCTTLAQGGSPGDTQVICISAGTSSNIIGHSTNNGSCGGDAVVIGATYLMTSCQNSGECDSPTPSSTPAETPSSTPAETPVNTPTPTSTCSPNYSLYVGDFCVACTDYFVYQNTNDCFTGNQYYSNGISYSSNPSTGACDTTADYSSAIGTLCISCVDYTVYQNVNPCFVGNQYYSNGISYSSNPSTGGCDTTADYSSLIGTLCISCVDYDVYQNVNPCFVGNQYYSNGISYASNPSTGACDTSADYSSAIGTLCVSCVNYTVYQNVNPCFVGNQYYSNGTSYASNPSTGACNTSADYSSYVGILCIGGNPGDTEYDVYQNINTCFVGDQYYTSYDGGTTYSTDPSTGPCPSATPSPTPTATPIIPCYDYTATASQIDIDSADNGTVYFEYVDCNGNPQTLQRGTTDPSVVCAQSVGFIYILIGGNQSVATYSSWSGAGGSC